LVGVTKIKAVKNKEERERESEREKKRKEYFNIYF